MLRGGFCTGLLWIFPKGRTELGRSLPLGVSPEGCLHHGC